MDYYQAGYHGTREGTESTVTTTPSVVFEDSYQTFANWNNQSCSGSSTGPGTSVDDFDPDVPLSSVETPSSNVPPGTPASSPINHGLAVSLPQTGQSLLPTRRPGRPRGGRLPPIEQLCRTLARASHKNPGLVEQITLLSTPKSAIATQAVQGNQAFAAPVGHPNSNGPSTVQMSDPRLNQHAMGQGPLPTCSTQSHSPYTGPVAGANGLVNHSPLLPPLAQVTSAANPGFLPQSQNHFNPHDQFNFTADLTSATGFTPINPHGGQPPPLTSEYFPQSNPFPPSHLQPIQSSSSTMSSAPADSFALSSVNQNQNQNQANAQLLGLFPDILNTEQGSSLVHDLPASVTSRPSIQKIFKMVSDPKQLPDGITPQQAIVLGQSVLDVTSATVNRTREANNKSAKRGRFKRMACTVALADEVLRLKDQLKRAHKEIDELVLKAQHPCLLIPGFTDTDGHPQQNSGTSPGQHEATAYPTTPLIHPYNDNLSGFFDEATPAGEQFDGSNFSALTTTAPKSTRDNALGIHQAPAPMTDYFGQPLHNQSYTGQQTSDNPCGLALPTLPPISSLTNLNEPTNHLSNHNPTAPTVPTGPSNQLSAAFALPSSTTQLNTDEFAIDRSFICEAARTRKQLIEAIKEGVLHELGFNCHDKIDAVIQRGRHNRHALGLRDTLWEDTQPSPKEGSSGHSGGKRRRQRASTAEFYEDEEEEEEEEEKKAPVRKRARRRG